MGDLAHAVNAGIRQIIIARAHKVFVINYFAQIFFLVYNVIVQEINKIVLLTAGRTFSICVVVFCYVIGVFTFLFPWTTASIVDGMGGVQLSAVYHVRAYERDKKSVEKLFYAFEKSIEADNTENIVKYGEKFLNDTDPVFNAKKVAFLKTLTETEQLRILLAIDRHLGDDDAELTGSLYAFLRYVWQRASRATHSA